MSRVESRRDVDSLGARRAPPGQAPRLPLLARLGPQRLQIPGRRADRISLPDRRCTQQPPENRLPEGRGPMESLRGSATQCGARPGDPQPAEPPNQDSHSADSANDFHWRCRHPIHRNDSHRPATKTVREVCQRRIRSARRRRRRSAPRRHAAGRDADPPRGGGRIGRVGPAPPDTARA